MAWKPKAVSSSGNFGDRGLSRVLIDKDKKMLGVQMKVGDKVKRFPIKAANTPETVQKWFKTGLPANDFYVSLNSDSDSIFGIYPANGMYIGRVKEFAHSEGEPPAPRLVETDKYSFQTFTVLVEIQEPKPFAGLIVPVSLSYHFQGVEDEYKGKQYTFVAYSKPKSRFTHDLMEFLEVTGTWDSGKPMIYKDNILPDLEKRILHADKRFQFVLKDARLQTVFSMDGLVPDEPEEEEEFDFTPEVESVETTTTDEELPWEENETIASPSLEFESDDEEDDDDFIEWEE